MGKDKVLKYAELIIENSNLEPELAEILGQIEELKKKGRAINEKMENNTKERWKIARELGMVKTTTIEQGKISEEFCKGIERSAKKSLIRNMLK